MFGPLHLVFKAAIRSGDVHVRDAGGRNHQFGDGTAPRVTLTIRDRQTERALAFDPALALGEAYMQDRIHIAEGTIYDFLALALQGLSQSQPPAIIRLLDGARYLGRGLKQLNSKTRAKSNITHHYDIDESIYRLFLDSDWQYSCAYFDDTKDLDTAQRAKKRHIAAKLCLKPEHKVLDIGSGWGGLALYLAGITGAHVTGITLSDNQLETSRRRVARTGLDHLASFQLQDYRTLSGQFDRIVSVGMLEHVGVNHYDRYFKQIARLLDDDGVALIHSIARADGPGATNPFIEKYIFPGGYFPALSEVLPAIERAGLIVSDVEILRLHYAETLKAWRQRFALNRDKVIALKDETFYRMWEFYLAGSEAAFRYDNLFVFQIQLAKRLDALPITRTYMSETEDNLAEAEHTVLDAGRLAGE